jgi:hypothetical protein
MVLGGAVGAGLRFAYGTLSRSFREKTEVLMSQRHRGVETPPPPPKAEVRAHAHNERHRIHSELSAVATQVSAGEPPEDVHEPGPAWKTKHTRPDRNRGDDGKQTRHWKLKMWKRRSAKRKEKAEQLRRDVD